VPKRVLGDERFAEHFCAVAAAPWRVLQILQAYGGWRVEESARQEVRAGECAPRARMPAGLATGVSAGVSAGTVARLPHDPSREICLS
jgi:hypothetical protein